MPFKPPFPPVAVPRLRRPERRGAAAAGALAAAVALLLAPAPALAVETLRFATDSASGEGWRARGIDVELALAPTRARVRVREVLLPGALGTARNLRIDCPALATAGGRYRCAAATVAGDFGPLGAQRFTTAFDYDSASGAIALDATGLALAGGAARVVAALAGSGWRVSADLAPFDLERAAALVRPWVALPAGFTVAGDATAQVAASGNAAGVAAARLEMAIRELTLASEDGTIATDRLAGRLVADLEPGEALAATVAFEATGGQGYVDPVFLDFAKRPLAVEADVALRGEDTLAVERFVARQPDALDATGTAEIALEGETTLRRATVRLDPVEFPGAGAFVAPFLAASGLANVTARGALRGTVELRDDRPVRVDLALEGIDVDDPDGALAFTQLAGRLRWREELAQSADQPEDDAPADAAVTEIGWQSGRLYGMALGQTRLRLAAYGLGFRLLEPAFVPVFDGGLAIERLRMRHIGQENMWLRLDARVEPISLALVTKALDWPEFGGTISGRIPRAALDDGVLTFGGNLEAEVFGGRVVARDLRLEQPLGRFPRMFANVDVENLDLQQVTGTFSFGEITGRLSGGIEGLELFAWEPVRFDARFATPPGDRSRRRISQRAVENISSIGGGGGIGAALQGGVLRFFDDFRYARLGIACRLDNDVCRMSGVEPRPDGTYYIVRGSGVPRIDIIGSGDRVAWSRLVSQLIAATESGTVEVR